MSFRLHPVRVSVPTLSDVEIKKRKASLCNIIGNPAAYSFVEQGFRTIISRYANSVTLCLYFFLTTHPEVCILAGQSPPPLFLSLLVNCHICIFIFPWLSSSQMSSSIFFSFLFFYFPAISIFQSFCFMHKKGYLTSVVTHVHERNTTKKKKKRFPIDHFHQQATFHLYLYSFSNAQRMH